jgi:hypothetical protein
VQTTTKIILVILLMMIINFDRTKQGRITRIKSKYRESDEWERILRRGGLICKRCVLSLERNNDSYNKLRVHRCKGVPKSWSNDRKRLLTQR